MMEFANAFLFASEAEVVALWGLGFVVLALFALFADKRRSNRANINRVGFMPWTMIFLGSMIIGGGLLALAVPRVIGALAG